MWYQRRTKRPTGPVLSVWWRPSEWSILVPDPLREIRCDAVDARLPAELWPLFEDDGYLREAPNGTTPIAWVEQALALKTPKHEFV